MRLICPNCDANYEVDAKVIPDNGRDVQCSACNETWFQAKDAPAVGANAPTDAPQDTVVDAAPAPEVAPVSDAPQRRPLDESVVDILREEASHEERARANESAPAAVAPQPAQEPEDILDEVLAQDGLTNDPADAAFTDTADIPADSNRADLLPDIDVINSTLRAASEESEGTTETEATTEAPRKSGFRTGFLMMIILLVAAVLVYTSAAAIIDFWPGGESYINAYVAWVDGLRVWLDGMMGKAAEGLSSLTEPAASE